MPLPLALALLLAVACAPGRSGGLHGTSPTSASDGDSGTDTEVFTGELGTILFVAQVPVAGFAAATSTFANHVPSMDALPRGGDLMLRYADGTLRNLTREAGFGSAEAFQGHDAIAVREPCVEWSGNRALFSMVVGAPDEQYVYETYRWQIYEVTGLARGESASIRRIEHQPDYDNVSPFYGTDGRILFGSDRPRSGEAHLFPLLDEYESAPSLTGLWSLDEASGDLRIIEHSPSGVFSPSIDSAGRVLFTKWDHLQRDQQGDTPDTATTYRPVTWTDESATADATADTAGSEVFPEARVVEDPSYDARFAPHSYNQFIPWTCNEDGSEEETVDHVGRHELGGSYDEGSYLGDPNLTYLQPQSYQANTGLRISVSGGLLQLSEDPTRPGDLLSTYAPEFYTAAGGPLVRLHAPVDLQAEAVTLEQLTDGGTWRDPLPMSDGTLVASWTADAGDVSNAGSIAAPAWNYDYRLVTTSGADGHLVPSASITGGLARDLRWWSPDVDVRWSGTLWELEAVEVAPRARPARRTPVLEAPEAAVFADVGVDVAAFRDWLRENDLALIVSRDVTQRDRADVQQPFNLQVPGGASSRGASGTMYDVSWLQIFQADQVRGYGPVDEPTAGRRVLPRPMHAAGASTSSGPEGSVPIAADGSTAALVPAGRALTWQLASPTGDGVVRERNWVSFAAGEVRTCAVCHGLNTVSQTGDPTPQNEPEALRTLLTAWVADQ